VKGRAVPLVRYFVVVTGVLLAMLAVVNWSLPSPPPPPSQEAEIDKSTLRIRSERKWPQKIEFDTAMHPFIAPSALSIATAETAVRPEKPPLDALAEAKPADKPSEPQATKPKPHVRMAHRTPRSAPRMMVAANPPSQQWSFGWGEPASGPQKQFQDTRASSRNSWFGEHNRQNVASWSFGGATDW
jgi:hypothetical protein